MEKASIDNSNNVINLSKKSWVAYVLPCFITFLICSIFYEFTKLLAIVPAGYLIYAVLQIRSYQLYMDDNGVWIFSGIFPWSKGVRGVKWRDLDDAVYFTSMFSWAAKSYKIALKHRYTKDNEIFLSHMKKGQESVMQINSRHQKLFQ